MSTTEHDPHQAAERLIKVVRMAARGMDEPHRRAAVESALADLDQAAAEATRRAVGEPGGESAA